MDNHLITWMVLLPMLGALLQAFLSEREGIWAALGASLAASVCGFVLVFSMHHTADLQAVETLSWIGSYAISYDMGIDGLNALLVLLVSIIFPVVIASERARKTGARGMHSLFLILQASFIGAVCAQDLFLQFFFWGLSSLPFYFLIGIWGGTEREAAAFRSIVAASIGNALLLAALILIYYSIEPHSFSLRELAGGKLNGKMFDLLGYEFSVPTVAVGLISLGVALRAAVWPFHGWFTRVAEEAPPSVFVAMCAVSIPIASYIFIRLCYTLFPETLLASAHLIVIVGAVNLLVGGICAAAQKDLMLLLAFMTLSEMGLLFIGIGSLNSAGVVGAVYQQLVLGTGLAGFGLISGLLARRTGRSVFLENNSSTYGGLAMKTPTVALFAAVFVVSILGFPGFGGFVGHALVIIGSYPSYPVTVILGAGAILLAIYYLFMMYRSVFFGNSNPGMKSFSDMTFWERAYFVPLVSGLLFCGIYPKPLLDLVRPTVLTLLSTIK